MSRNTACVSCGGYHEHGEPISAQDHELPMQDRDGRPGDGRSLEQIGAEWSADVFAERHRDCEAPWFCERCERPQCPRCMPSPGEFKLCADCDWGSAA